MGPRGRGTGVRKHRGGTRTGKGSEAGAGEPLGEGGREVRRKGGYGRVLEATVLLVCHPPGSVAAGNSVYSLTVSVGREQLS